MIHLEDSAPNEYLDGRLGETERQEVAGHLAGCAYCQGRLEELQDVFQSLNALSEAPLERDLSPQILARLAAEARPWRAPRWLRVALLTALGAAITAIIQLANRKLAGEE